MTASAKPDSSPTTPANARMRPGQWLSRISASTARLLKAGRGESAGPGVGVIGLDIGLESLNLVQLRRSGNGEISLVAKACLSHGPESAAQLASPAAFKARLRQVFSKQPFVGRRVVSALPAQSVRTLPVPYDIGGGKSDTAAIIQVLRERLDKDLSGYVIDYMPVRADNQANDRLALAVVAQRDVVLAHLELLRQAGLDVQALEIRPSAIKRLITVLSSPHAHENQMVITFGEATSYLTVISGQRLLQDQKITFGECDLLKQISTALDMTEDEARGLAHGSTLDDAAMLGQADAGNDLAHTLVEIIRPRLIQLVEEINRMSIYTASESRGAAISRIHLLGSLARWSGIEKQLQTLLKIPVAILDDPLDLFAESNDAVAHGGPHDGQMLAVATGLALRGLGPELDR